MRNILPASNTTSVPLERAILENSRLISSRTSVQHLEICVHHRHLTIRPFPSYPHKARTLPNHTPNYHPKNKQRRISKASQPYNRLKKKLILILASMDSQMRVTKRTPWEALPAPPWTHRSEIMHSRMAGDTIDLGKDNTTFQTKTANKKGRI